ncbi:MAG: hypothetical protein H6740_07495 [Alphaproteobacteria bacterium]|nr:hypothetical protein [Alphaproteobacteria bacterium]
MLTLLLLAACAEPCPEGRCEVELGELYIAEPARASGVAVIYLHGAGGSGPEAIHSEAITGAFLDAGALVVAPDGLDGYWRVSAWGDMERDEVAFHDQILSFLREELRVRSVYMTAFSLGSSIAYELACERSEAFDGFYTMSGQLWDPLPEACPGPSVRFVHRHGTQDETFPIEGRDFGRASQGDLMASWQLWLDRGECEALEAEGDCERWRCDGELLERCISDYGHARPSGWAADAVERFGL